VTDDSQRGVNEMKGKSAARQYRYHFADIRSCGYNLVAALAKERIHNAQLQRRIEEMIAGHQGSGGSQDAVSKPILRPSGTAGTDFSIQEAMGLAGSKQKYETYKGLQVRLLRTYACGTRGY
jgi:hypothetical protein